MGARIQLHTDATSPVLMSVDQRSEVDVMMGTGGTPEGVLAACAIKGAGAPVLARLRSPVRSGKAAIQEAGIDLAQILDADTLVQGDDVFFAATGISGGGIYIEDYSDLETQVEQIAHVDLIEQDLLDKDRTKVIVHLYLAPDENPAEVVELVRSRLAAAEVDYTLAAEGVEQDDWETAGTA